jgi:hypothetical protein
MLCIVLGQCMAGICTTFGGFIACQGVIFGIGLGCVSFSSHVPVITDDSVLHPNSATSCSMVRSKAVLRCRTYTPPMPVRRLTNRESVQQAQDLVD